MAIPQNRNIRKLKVDNIEYYWTIKYDEDYGDILCHVGLVEMPNFRFGFVRGADDSHKKWIDNGVKKEEQVKAISPSIVRQAILYANKNLDWKNSKSSFIPYDSEWFLLK